MKSISKGLMSGVVKKHESTAHKGNYGRVLLIGGNKRYGGALIMSAEGALNSGTGLTMVAADSVNISVLHTRDPEVMALDWGKRDELEDLIVGSNIIVCGVGLGLDDQARDVLAPTRDNISLKRVLILGASALDLVSQQKGLLPVNSKLVIFTPHQMEWQRLSKAEIANQNDQSNQTFLDELVPRKSAILVLKSNHTKIYDQVGNIYQNPFGNPRVAIGGMGNTLVGIIDGFCGQYTPNLKTVVGAVGIRPIAADEITRKHYIVRLT